MASQLTAAVFEAAAMAVKKSQSVSIPNAHRRGSDATVSRHFNIVPEPQCSLQNHATTPSVATTKHPLGGVSVVEAKASDEGTTAMFHLLAEASSAITPALLAKHHLPTILLLHGPLAIRHITAHLISTLPGFSSIPPAKQRRIVVGALEGKGGPSGFYGEVGGVNGDVIFEKIGWGRWDARKRGDPPRPRPGAAAGAAPISPLLSATRDAADMVHSGSYTESGIFHQSEEEGPHDEDVQMDDSISLDAESSDTSEDDDMTDEEDWAQMGAAALRRQGGSPITSDGWCNSYAKSPGSGFIQWNKGIIVETPEQKRVREEREAVEALVKLSSV